MKKSLALALIVTSLGAGCGGSGGGHGASETVRTTRHADTRLARDYRRLFADVRAMRAAADKTTKSTLLGTPRLQQTTGDFLDDLDRASLTLKEQNRMIDHAAAAVATSCGQCFQMLEAVRPIPAIAGH